MGDLASIVAAALALAGFTINGPATAYEPAVRGAQTQLEAPDGVDDCAEMRFYLDLYAMPARFDQIGWRESNCRNEDAVRTRCCHGYLQLNADLHVRDHRLQGPYAECGVFGNDDINSDTPEDKRRHACAASKLYALLGYQPWSTS